ncbi:MBL fold metallo-hydrolase [Flavitalea sp. BT771]|uniref:MBL fold metallo-hydrolase n=1 Tax=Flavitalea sp. BT771 TaxID=3063329 RepID=UPI0026E372C4|nr:MBL fold metallo-hydrolase [Flavitalea sp. BT771]MDO6431379.1 MBL fold metallo-hydrolase [Flavitalea sp. BT771]MDV6220287.1 MBL fold metallo-hydrolase [Flavitalea sp. BT771]
MKKYNILAFAFCLIAAGSHAQRSAADVVPTSMGPLTIQPVMHASLVLSLKSFVIYADPSGGAAKFKGLPAPDMILITDIHGDHFDSSTLAAIKTEKTILVVPQVVADKLTAFDKSKLVILKNGDHVTQSDVSITAVPMYNLPESPTAKHTKGRGNGYILGIGGKNIYLSGDTQGIPEMRALKNIDIAFVCMNLPYTMDVNEAADAVLAFQPKIVYPYHYRGQDIHQFQKLVDAGNKGIDVRLREWYPANL